MDVDSTLSGHTGWRPNLVVACAQRVITGNAEAGNAKKVVRQESSKLGLEVASLSRPERLREYAITTLHMVPPKPMQVVHQ